MAAMLRKAKNVKVNLMWGCEKRLLVVAGLEKPDLPSGSKSKWRTTKLHGYHFTSNKALRNLT